MQGNSDPMTPMEADAMASQHHHHHGHGQGSFSPSSSASSSPRVSTYIDHIMFENPSGRGTQGLAGAASTPTGATLKSPTFSESAPAPDADEDPDPYPLWRRPSTSTNAAKSPRRSSSSSSSSSSMSSWSSAPSSSSSCALAPSSSSSSSLFTSPTGASTNLAPTGVGAVRGARKTTPCQYTGCSRNAEYGELDEAPIACQAHKRAGQYTTNRHGELLKATRDGDGKNRPRLWSTKCDGSPASKIRSCLFPGCDAQPLYGLKEAVRPIYCFYHKKDPMMQLVEEASKRHDNGDGFQKAASTVAREGAASKGKRRHQPAETAPASASERDKQKSRASPAAADKRVTKKARRGSKEKAATSDGAGEKHTKRGRGHTQKGKGGHDVSRKVIGLTATSYHEQGATTSEAVSPCPSSNRRPAETTGMAPSAEILLLQQAREAAKREAEARGGGRRARAPSRRALEAAGRMTDQGAQWMTQEKKEEQARAATELREQRKRHRAAGLKVGVVLKEFVA
eukprot:g17900.t1